ncbi:MAG: hypothetical protein H6Q03_2387 [Acidobacteria bacterium]|nr:hypothetical protein [Acidobacteriota bacterium]
MITPGPANRLARCVAVPRFANRRARAACAVCGAALAKVSGKSGGYYGCLGATKGTCENKLLVRRTLVERLLLAGVRDRLASAENLRHVLERVVVEIRAAQSATPNEIRLKAAELEAEQRRVHALGSELEDLRVGEAGIPEVPPLVWIEERVERLQELLERRTER